jgi:hypothetical protein
LYPFRASSIKGFYSAPKRWRKNLPIPAKKPGFFFATVGLAGEFALELAAGAGSAAGGAAELALL